MSNFTLSGEASFTIALPGAAGGADLTLAVADFPAHILWSLAEHGLQQKVADATANAKAKGWSESVSLEACEKVIESLRAGTWAKRVSGPRAKTAEAYADAQAEKAAKLRMSKDPKAAAAGLDRVKAAFLAAKGAAWRAEWEAKREALDLDLSL